VLARVSGRREGGARSAITIRRYSRRYRLRCCRRRPRSSRRGLGTPCRCTRAQAASCSPACSRGASGSPWLAPLMSLEIPASSVAVPAERSLRVRYGQRPEPHGADRHTSAAAQPQHAGARPTSSLEALQSSEPPPCGFESRYSGHSLPWVACRGGQSPSARRGVTQVSQRTIAAPCAAAPPAGGRADRDPRRPRRAPG